MLNIEKSIPNGTYVEGIQQFGERIQIAFAEGVNRLSQGRFNLQPEFTGKNREKLDFLKEKYAIFYDVEGYGNGDKALIAFYGSNVSRRKLCDLWLCLSRVDRELRAHGEVLDSRITHTL